MYAWTNQNILFILFWKMLRRPSSEIKKKKKINRNNKKWKLKGFNAKKPTGPLQSKSFVFGLWSHVEGDQAVDGPSHSQRHGGPVKHLVRQASFQVDGHTIRFLEKLLQLWNFVFPSIIICGRIRGQFSWGSKYDRWCFCGNHRL